MNTCGFFQGLLTKDALAAVKELLPESAGGDLAAVCSWPDEIRHYYHWRWSGPLHYLDTPDFLCNYKYCSKFVFRLTFHCLKMLFIALH
jgi:hypothetical protein